MYDVGGHARTIETIADELDQYQNGFQPNITELANTILNKLKLRYYEIVEVLGNDVLPVIQCILSRQLIRLRGFIPGSTLWWEHIIAPGLLWFEQNEKASDSEYGAEGYLVAPYIWLWLFARVLPTEDERLYQFLTEWEFNDYQRLLHLETGKGPTGKVTWQDRFGLPVSKIRGGTLVLERVWRLYKNMEGTERCAKILGSRRQRHPIQICMGI